MNESLLHQAFLAVLPTCLQLSGWKDGSGGAIHSTDSRVRLAWTVALTACEMHPTSPAIRKPMPREVRQRIAGEVLKAHGLLILDQLRRGAPAGEGFDGGNLSALMEIFAGKLDEWYSGRNAE